MIDIILTTYNRLPLLKRTVDSFLACTDRLLIQHLIISNDGSTDGTTEYLDELASRLSFVRLVPRAAERVGLILRFNTAYAMATTDHVCEIQDDIQFYPGWLEQQLAALKSQGQKIDFVSGYDGEEHKSFVNVGTYKIKHSNGFVQLLAKREIWDRWFPMKPTHDFPTPCRKDGRSTGSGIDTGIYGRKNNPQGAVRYLIVPGLIHTANRYNSNWRPPIEKRHRFNRIKSGGLDAFASPGYWKSRFEKQGTIAVGFAGRPTDEQQRIVETKQAFIRNAIKPELFTIDYGCGIGLFSTLCRPDRYLGMDLTTEFLCLAAKRNPDYWYMPTGPIPEMESQRPIQQFLTVNVLQHNNDHVVGEIFRSLAQRNPEGGIRFVLYENSMKAKNSGHMRFRQPDEYVGFIAEHFAVISVDKSSHVVHGEEHSLTVVQV